MAYDQRLQDTRNGGASTSFSIVSADGRTKRESRRTHKIVKEHALEESEQSMKERERRIHCTDAQYAYEAPVEFRDERRE